MIKSEKKLNILYQFLFWIIILFHAINNFIWLRNSTDMKGTDVPNHLLFQLRFHHILNNLISDPYIFILTKLQKFIELMNMPMTFSKCIYWPNFVYLSSTSFSLFFGNSLFVIKMTTFIYFLILLFSVYFIAKNIMDRQTAIIAMFLISMCPLIFESSRQYSLDLPLTAVVTLSILMLLKTAYFTNTFFSILLGIISGIAMLIKGQFLLFFIWPLIVILGNSFFKKNEKKNSKLILFNIFIFFIIAAAIASIWWFDKLRIAGKGLIEHISSKDKFLESGTIRKMYNFDFYFYHLRTLISSSIGYPLSIVFIVSLFYLIKSRFKYKVLMIVWILVPFILFSVLFVVKQARLLMPILPAIAILSALGIRKLNSKVFKTSIIVFTVFIALMQFFILSYYDWYKDKVKIARILYAYNRTCYAVMPHYDFEKIMLTKEAADTITEDCRAKGKCKIGTVIFLGRMMGTTEILYWLYYWNSDFELMDWLENYASFSKELPSLNYLIFISFVKDGFIWPKGEDFLNLVSRYKDLRKFKIHPAWDENFRKLSASESNFYLLKKIVFSNKICWYIYKNKNINN